MTPALRPPPALSHHVCIIVPALNEAGYIEACLESLLRQTDERIVEIIVSDGGSTDGTVDLVRRIGREHPSVRLMDNPGRIQSIGFNLAARMANETATVLVRADAHMEYAPDFVKLCVDALMESGATSVVVPMRTVGTTRFQRAVALIQNSRLGNGGSAHRTANGRSCFVRHGHHAAFNRAFFTARGGYDESFTHNEDVELDHRAHLAGGRVWMCAEACVNYFPRSTPIALARQYRRNGGGRARTLLKHRLRPGMRQLAPVMLLPILLASVLLALAWWPFVLVPASYLVMCSVPGIISAVRQRDAWLMGGGLAAVIMHLGFATGFIQTLGSVFARSAANRPRNVRRAAV